MPSTPSFDRPSLVVGGFGACLFLAAVAYHATEIRALARLPGPLLSLALDTVPAVGLMYAGYRLSVEDVDREGRWLVCAWTFVGSAGFVGVVWATIAVRGLEGRTIGEPLFPLLVAAATGAVAGYVAGYFHARARRKAREARTIADGFAFVNSFIRHDLQNDLSTIRGYAQTIDEDGVGDRDGATVIEEKAEEALTRIETSGAVAETLVDDADRARVDLASVARDIVRAADATYTTTVTADIPESAPIAANAGVRSVVDNLVENAVEHNDAVNPVVHVAVETTGAVVRLTVRDNGPGMPAERRRVIEAGDAALEGGLRLVDTLVDRYGGDVRVEDVTPRGTAFVVELQRWQSPNGVPGGEAVGTADSEWPS